MKTLNLKIRKSIGFQCVKMILMSLMLLNSAKLMAHNCEETNTLAYHMNQMAPLLDGIVSQPLDTLKESEMLGRVMALRFHLAKALVMVPKGVLEYPQNVQEIIRFEFQKSVVDTIQTTIRMEEVLREKILDEEGKQRRLVVLKQAISQLLKLVDAGHQKFRVTPQQRIERIQSQELK